MCLSKSCCLLRWLICSDVSHLSECTSTIFHVIAAGSTWSPWRDLSVICQTQPFWHQQLFLQLANVLQQNWRRSQSWFIAVSIRLSISTLHFWPSSSLLDIYHWLKNLPLTEVMSIFLEGRHSNSSSRIGLFLSAQLRLVSSCFSAGLQLWWL